MEAVFLKILNMSLSAAIIICVVLLVRLALRRAPKKWSYLLWAVVAFRLLCPVSFSAPFSVLRLATQPAAVTQSAESAASTVAYIPQDIGYMAQPRVYMGTPAVSEAVSQSLPAATLEDSANPMQVWIAVGVGLWCLGMAALLLYGIISYVNLKLRLRGAVRVENGVFETDAVRSPFILGLYRPTIYLPVGLEGEPLRFVLAHERFHICRGDHAVKLLAFLLLCIHWFNPLVWLAYYLMSRDMEMRCDEAVLSGENGILKPYSMALLSFAAARRFPSPSPLCFGESGVKGRIRNVLNWKKPRVWVTALCALLCVVTVVACAANPSKAAERGEPRATPWSWTSTVTAGDIQAAGLSGGGELTPEQMRELTALLNAVEKKEIVLGRGIPSQNVLDITAGIGYRLRWAGGIIELDFDDSAAAAELYGSPDTLGPGVWEIHNGALYEFLEALEEPTPDSNSDLTSAASLSVLQQSDPARFLEMMERWDAEVNMIGEQFVSECGEAGNWWDIPEAFAERWCRKYLDASEDSPFRCSDAIIWQLGDYMNAASLTGSPRRLAFNVTLALGVPAEKEELFVFARMGWVSKNENGMLVIGNEAVLVSDDGVHWTVEGLNTGGSAGWGFRTLVDSERTEAELRHALEIKEPIILLRLLPNMDWDKLSGEEIKTAMELLQAAAVSDDPAYLNGQDQLIRDLYMLWGVKRADGAYAEIYLDGPDCILDRQRRADQEVFEAALAEMDAVTQQKVKLAMQYW